MFPSDHHSARITKAGKNFSERLDFEDINFKLEIFTKFEEWISSALVFLVIKIRKNIKKCIKKCCEEKPVDLWLIGQDSKMHCSYKRF